MACDHRWLLDPDGASAWCEVCRIQVGGRDSESACGWLPILRDRDAQAARVEALTQAVNDLLPLAGIEVAPGHPLRGVLQKAVERASAALGGPK